jgi:hypothetical protein
MEPQVDVYKCSIKDERKPISPLLALSFRLVNRGSVSKAYFVLEVSVTHGFENEIS